MSDQDLIDAAVAVRARAYSPYSSFQVGSAVRIAGGHTFCGTNVENSSYPLSVCAERHAIAAAVTGGMQPGELEVVAIAADAPGPTPPCGACRQVLMEFGAPGTRVLMHNVRDGSTEETTLGDLLPRAFVASSMGKP